MELKLKRIAKKETYTIGKLYIEGVYFCDTLEDKDRGLSQSDSLATITKKKVYAQTAVPTGRYEVTLSIVSPKYSVRAAYKFCQGKLPRLLDIPGFEGILIHIGNTADDSAGCILVGRNKVVGGLIDSTVTFKELYNKLKQAKTPIYITIE